MRSQRFGSARHNFYIAAVPPPALAEELLRTWRALGAPGSFRGPKLHLSLVGLAARQDFDARLVEDVRAAIDGLELPKFELLFDQFMAFGHGEANRALVVASRRRENGLDALAREVHRAVRRRMKCLGAHRRPTPHVTLAYGDPFPGARELARPICWDVSEISLVDNWIGVPRYEQLARWPLTRALGWSPDMDRPIQLPLPGF